MDTDERIFELAEKVEKGINAILADNAYPDLEGVLQRQIDVSLRSHPLEIPNAAEVKEAMRESAYRNISGYIAQQQLAGSRTRRAAEYAKRMAVDFGVMIGVSVGAITGQLAGMAFLGAGGGMLGEYMRSRLQHSDSNYRESFRCGLMAAGYGKCTDLWWDEFRKTL
ncbi:hypothetical protein J4475_03860 [Candidatus Woesearchaeota archaeon]|nr:hypothetical protein [Candidatus Woesearchaeota archaeon]